ncbi:MAG: c-type cytochrome [Thermodesulfobacteriota bacterium]
MIRRTKPLLRIVPVCFFLAWIPLVYVGCDYARMKDQESIRTYEAEPPEMPARTIPVSGGSEVLKNSKPEDLHNPLLGKQEVLERGRLAYGYFCIMCHGQQFDGNGTVGQSFSPLPTDLKSPNVRQQSDGELFYKISFGYKRHPALASTVSEEDRWAILRYIRSIQ